MDHADIKVTFLLPHTSLLQSMEVGVIKTFKCYYTRMIYRKVLCAFDSSALTLMDFVKCYNSWNALVVIKEAWDDMKPSPLTACWNSLWAEQVNDLKGSSSMAAEISALVMMALHLQ